MNEPQNISSAAGDKAIAARTGGRKWSREGARRLRNLGLLPSGLVPKDQLLTFTRCLGILLGSGVNVLRAFEIVGAEPGHAEFKQVISQVAQELEAGVPMSIAMSQHPGVFSSVYLSMVHIGESIGRLPQMLLQTADFLARDRDLEMRARAATIYPTFVLAVCVVLTLILINWVIPPLLSVLIAMCGPGAVLPLPTRLLQHLVSITSNGLVVGAGGALVIIGLAYVERFLDTAAGRRLRDRLLLCLPALGVLNRKLLAARFCRSLGTLLGAGVPLQGSLAVMARFIDNTHFNEVYGGPLAANIADGVSMSAAMATSKFFPRLVWGLVMIGEETGRLPTTISQVVGIYDAEVNHALDTFLQVVEPILVLLVGVVVGFVMVGVFMPLYQVAAAMGR